MCNPERGLRGLRSIFRGLGSLRRDGGVGRKVYSDFGVVLQYVKIPGQFLDHVHSRTYEVPELLVRENTRSVTRSVTLTLTVVLSGSR